MITSKKIKRSSEHILFWVLYWVFTSFSAGLYDFDFGTVALYSLSNLPLTIATTYLFVYTVLPYYTKGKIFQFLAFSLVLLTLALLLNRISVQYIQFPLFYANTNWTFTFFDWYRIVGHLLKLCAIIGLVSALKSYRDWKRTKDKLEIIQTEKRKLELSYLKAQTSPHFLFNTLNSIYYDVVNKKDNSADSIIRLSESLRFVLYECDKEWISVEKEIQLINNYIELQKSRYQNRLIVNFEMNGDQDALIPPLISFSLIENAFKHGMSESIGNCKIDIDIQVDENYFAISIKNPVSPPIKSDSDLPKGLGLENVNRQLTLIYSDNYVLTNITENETYTCNLKIPLKET